MALHSAEKASQVTLCHTLLAECALECTCRACLEEHQCREGTLANGCACSNAKSYVLKRVET